MRNNYFIVKEKNYSVKGLNVFLTLCFCFLLNVSSSQDSKNYESYVGVYFKAKMAEASLDYGYFDELLNQCIKIDKNQSIAYFSKSQLFYLKQDFSLAIKYCLIAIEKEMDVPFMYFEHLFNCYEQNNDFINAFSIAEELIVRYPNKNYYKLLYLETLYSLKRYKIIASYIDVNKNVFDENLVDFSLNFYFNHNPDVYSEINKLYLIKEALVSDHESVLPHHISYLLKNNQRDMVLNLLGYQFNPIYNQLKSLLLNANDFQISFEVLNISQHLILISMLEYVNDATCSEALKNYWLINIDLIQDVDLLNKLYSFAVKNNYTDLSKSILQCLLIRDPKNLQVIGLLSSQLLKQQDYKKTNNIVTNGLMFYPYDIDLLLKQLYLSIFISSKEYHFLLNEITLLTLSSTDELNIKLINFAYSINVEKTNPKLLKEFYNDLNKNDKLFIQQEIEKKWLILQPYL